MNTRARTKGEAPSEAATYERARRLANIAVWAIRLQHRRLKSKEPEDAEFLFRRWYDFHFLIVALTRCRRAALLAAHVKSIAEAIRAALEEFDTALPSLKVMRDTAEHVDDYALDHGRDDEIVRQSLEVAVVGENSIEWLGHRLDVDVALAAAQRPFDGIRAAIPTAVVR